MAACAELDWEGTRVWLADSPTRLTLTARLMSVADRLAPVLLGSGTAPAVWRRLGLVVVRRSLRDARGLSDPWSTVVLVDRHGHPRQQRFTVGHELAHLLLAEVDRPRLELSHEHEERLCEAFALRLLIPPDDLGRQPEARRLALGDVLALSRRYDVGLTPMLQALSPTLERCGRLVIAASRRGHPRRPGEIDLRAHGVRCGDFYVPAEKRLSTLGLEDVVRCAQSARTGSGTAPEVELKLWRPGAHRRSGSAVGPARWSMLRVRGGVVLVEVETAALVCAWAMPAERASAC